MAFQLILLKEMGLHIFQAFKRSVQRNFIYCTAESHTTTYFLLLLTYSLSWAYTGCFHYAMNVLQAPAAILITCRDRDE